MTDDIRDWKNIATTLHEALPQIDKALSQANVPISARIQKALEILQGTILEISNYKAFFHSTAHGRLLVIIENWYRGRYGNAVDNDKIDVFVSMLIVHGTPFAMRVPINFKTSTDEPNTFWIGFPASVQAEEDPLNWIESGVGLGGLSHEELNVLSSTLYEFGQVSACNRPIASSPADRPEGFLPTRYRALMLKNTRPSTGAAVPLPKRR